MRSVPRLVHRLVAMTVTAAAGLVVCSLSLLSGERPVLTVGAVSAATVVGAVLTGWRWLGSAAAFAVTVTVLMAAAISSDRVLAWHLVVASVGIMTLIAGLDGLERSARSPRLDPIGRLPASRRVLVPALGLAATAGVALVAARPAVPSVGLVLLGLAAAVAALVVATSTS